MDKVTRVKYKNDNGVFHSTKKFLGGDGALLSVTINPSTNVVNVVKVTDTGDSLVEETHTKSFTEAKRSAKSLLKKYGVQFHDEIRKTK